MAHSHEMYIYMHMYVRQESHFPKTQETKGPKPDMPGTQPVDSHIDIIPATLHLSP